MTSTPRSTSTAGCSPSSCAAASAAWPSSTSATSSSPSPRAAARVPTRAATSASSSTTATPSAAALAEAGIEPHGGRGLRFTDPWGNQFEIVEYADVQFSKTAGVLRGMGLEGLEKSESARAELAEKGLGEP